MGGLVRDARLGDELLAHVEQLAHTEQVSRSEMLRRLVREAVDGRADREGQTS
ncbi:MAG: CopG family transcriptional regulator [Phycicoccus sp.]